MTNHEIHEPIDFNEVLRKLQTSDPAHADTFNPLFERLINNDVFLKNLTERLIQEHTHSGKNGEGSKIPLDNIDVPTGLGDILTAKELAEHVNERNPHGTRAVDVGAASAQEFAKHLADDAAHGIGDKASLLTTDKTSIVSAMNELFTNANNGKTDIASVIGSPATDGDTFIQLKTLIQDSKNTLAANLSNKSQPADGSEALVDLIAKVANVNTGKKFASGSNYVEVNTGLLTVTGLDFRPSYVIGTGKGYYRPADAGGPNFIIGIRSGFPYYYKANSNDVNYAQGLTGRNSGGGNYYIVKHADVFLEDGFSIPTAIDQTTLAMRQIEWHAFE